MSGIPFSLRACAAALLLPGAAFGQATIQQILNNGPTSNRINIVFLSEGYRSSELSKYLNTDVATMLNRLLSNQPFQEYSPYFNAYAISVASNESGSDHPPQGIYHDTFFSSTFYSYGVERLLTLQGNGYFRVDSLLQLLMPEYDLVIVIVNDPEYGGSGGSIAVTSINGQSPEIVVHETGHSFGHLGDEYGDATPGYSGSETPNTTAETRRDYIKWRAWIDGSTPLPTPQTGAYGNVIGLFEGASYEQYGWYRPKLGCKMRTLGVPFCEVCVEDLLLSSYHLLRPVESFSPSVPAIPLTDPQSALLSVHPLVPLTHGLDVRWTDNGIALPGAVLDSFPVNSRALGNGTHRITARVADLTTFVRNDTLRLLQDSASWTVNVSGVTFLAPLLSSPADRILSQPTTLALSWHPAGGASSYAVQVSGDSLFFAIASYDTSVTDTFRSVGPLPNGAYYWRVAAANPGGWSAFSPSRKFTTLLGPPVTVEPANGDTNQRSSLKLIWRRTSGATAYHLLLASDSLFTTSVVDNPSVADTFLTVGPLNFTTTYYWRLSASNSGDTGPYSPTRSFTTGISPPGPPLLIFPADGSTGQPVGVTFRWHPASTAFSYHLQISIDSLFRYNLDQDIPTTDTSVYAGGLAYLTTYYWRIAAENSGGRGEFSPYRRFTTSVERPVLFSPHDGSVDQQPTLALFWNSIANAVSYRVQVAGDSLFASPVVDDSAVTHQYRTVGPLSFGTTYYWRVGAKKITGNLPFSSSWRFTITSTVNIQLNASSRWNILSVPVDVADYSKQATFPQASSPAFSFGEGYSIADTLVKGKGYWLRFPSDQSLNLQGKARLTDTISLEPGWNMIGSISDTVAAGDILETPSGIVQSRYFAYDGGYVRATTIDPGRGYWVKAGQAGGLVLRVSATALPKAPIAIETDPLRSLSRLSVEDEAGHCQEVYFGPPRTMNLGAYEMPPPAPEPRGLDVRFGSGRMVEFADAGKGVSYPLLISSDRFPLTLRWDLKKESSGRAFLLLGGRTIPLGEAGSAQLREAPTSARLHLLGSLPEGRPGSFSLEQNYPNPFNPRTEMRYALPEASRVRLEIYDLLGRRVATLVDEAGQPGFYTAVWDASSFPSGVYFSRLTAAKAGDGGNGPEGRIFSSVKKIILMK